MSDLLSIKRRAEKIREAYGTENPFIIAEGLGIVVLFRNLGSLKGFYTIEKRIPYIVINSSLDEYTAKVVCAHELGHDRLHKRLARNGMLNEYELYLVNTKTELEANTFAAHLLISDKDLSRARKEMNGSLVIGEAAVILGTTPEILEIKLGTV